MPKIRILPDQLSNQIAAGEVVERPASVVKELIENSLDSGASRIDIEVENGGTRLIKVIDNGHGMDEDDALLCFERHGTSKISKPEDLGAIETLGFRGEAIPSIASVSKMSVITRTKNSPLGTMVQFEYGKLIKVHETGCSQGTIMEVRNLFARTPARKKFLRTNRTELGHIDEIIKNYSLSYPSITFTLRVNGKETISMSGGADLENRIRTILNYNRSFIPIENRSKRGQKRSVYGLLVPPEESIASSARLRLFINNRAVRDRLMSHAVGEGLRGFMLKGHAPAGFLHLSIPNDEVDVNVHPAKTEVRFHNGNEIHHFIKQSIQEAMIEYQGNVKQSFFSAHQREDDEKSSFPPAVSEKNTAIKHRPLSFNNNSGSSSYSTREPLTQLHSTTAEKVKKQTTADIELEQAPIFQSKDSEIEEKGEWTVKGEAVAHHGMQIIGQFKNLYIFAQAGENLIVIDQHAAHERLLYERFKKQFFQSKVAGQTLLFPTTVELSPFQIQLVEKNVEDLNKLGFSINEFGGNSYVITAIPALVGTSDPVELFFDILEGFGKEDKGRSKSGRLDDILATMACKAAIKSGDSLNEQEINGLINNMIDADLFSHCPHGRPVVRIFENKDIKKWFYRT